jgi:hypothetical protein
MNRPYVLFCGLVLATLPLTAAWADTIYTYTGNHFDAFDYTLKGYSSSDFISLLFDVASPLAPNLSSEVIIPTSFSITGFETLNNVTDPLSAFVFSTDASGKIEWWIIETYNQQGRISLRSGTRN